MSGSCLTDARKRDLLVLFTKTCLYGFYAACSSKGSCISDRPPADAAGREEPTYGYTARSDSPG